MSSVNNDNHLKYKEKNPSGPAKSAITNNTTEAWSVVEKSRHPKRPYSLDYIRSIFIDYEEIKGDRRFAEDPAIVAGFGVLKGKIKRKVFFVGNQKGRNTKEKVERNFGMAKPEGYRKVLRTIELAERFKKPLITFIDTPGAYPGMDAEERGQSEAIASSIQKLFNAKTPSIGIVIGEGGSGGALALGMTDKLLMLQNATYSVISPESCAAILWGYAGEAKAAAQALRLAAPQVFKLGLCDEVISEDVDGAHQSFESVSERLLERIHHHLKDLGPLEISQLLQKRFEKYRNIDKIHLPSDES